MEFHDVRVRERMFRPYLLTVENPRTPGPRILK
jgi:hypothetical protein